MGTSEYRMSHGITSPSHLTLTLELAHSSRLPGCAPVLQSRAAYPDRSLVGKMKAKVIDPVLVVS